MAWQEGRQCSIGPMRARIAWLAGAVTVAGAAAYKRLRRSEPAPAEAPAEDPRAEELRRKLDESRTIVEEREEFESAETPVDAAEPVEVADRRKAVHERGRAAADEMRGNSSD
jgi:hypothetical protein